MSVTSATHSDYNICLLSTPSEAAEKYKSEAFKADVKAKISLVVLAVLTIVSVTLSAIKAPIFVPVILIVAGASVKTFHSKFYLKYKEEASKYTDFAKHMLGVAAKIDSYQQKNLTPFLSTRLSLTQDHQLHRIKDSIPSFFLALTVRFSNLPVLFPAATAVSSYIIRVKNCM